MFQFYTLDNITSKIHRTISQITESAIILCRTVTTYLVCMGILTEYEFWEQIFNHHKEYIS